MSSTVLDTDMDAATNSLRQHREGIPVEDDFYRRVLKEHDKGNHRGFWLRTCPACAEDHKE